MKRYYVGTKGGEVFVTHGRADEVAAAYEGLGAHVVATFRTHAEAAKVAAKIRTARRQTPDDMVRYHIEMDNTAVASFVDWLDDNGYRIVHESELAP